MLGTVIVKVVTPAGIRSTFALCKVTPLVNVSVVPKSTPAVAGFVPDPVKLK